MANNEKNTVSNGLNVGEIGMIRNILMGEQINDFEQRFKSLQDRISELEQQLSTKINNLDEAAQLSMAKAAEEQNVRFAEIEKQIMTNVEKLHHRIDKVSKDDKARLGKMLEKVSKQLIGE